MQPLAAADLSRSQSSNTNLSRSISLTVLDQNGNEVSIQTDLTHPIELIIPRDPNVIIPSMTLQNITSTLHQQLFNLHYINITSTLTISIHLEIHPLNINIGYLLIYKFDSSPQLNSSIQQIDGWTLLCPLNQTNDTIYTYFIDNQQTSDHRSLIFGLRELNSSERNHFCSNSSILNPPITNERFNFTSNYELRVYTSGCYYLDQTNQWQSNGLTVGSLTNHYQTQCFSTHLTTFASGFIVLPAPVNWNYVFTHADFMKNKTVYLTIISVLMIYLLLTLYARYKDKKDLEKLGVTSLSDNHPSDQYFYQLLVFTGQRKESGTMSKVHFILSGEKDDTQVRTLVDPHRKIFQRGGIDAFILAVPKSLGLLNYLRIWHDNTGHGTSASWFLKYLIIQDLQTMEKYHFICQQWLAVEKDDGKIERVLFVANELEKQGFSYVLSKKTYHNISDGHLWFSIFSRPIANQFTRVQRCTCCFVLLFISMFLNIMYYDLSTEAKLNNSTSSTASLSLGPLYISSQQIAIGVIVELFSLIPSLLLIQFFQRLRARQQPLSSLHQALYKLDPARIISEASENDKDSKKKKKSKLTFPWWCIYLAYALSFSLVGVSILFIIARGIEFGDLKTQKWLTSILTGFFSSILFTQPLKVLCLTILFTLITRDKSDDQEVSEHLDLDNVDVSNEEEEEQQNKSLFTYRPMIRFDRLNEAEVAYARHQRLKELHMWSIIQEAMIYIAFLFILGVLTYSNCDQNAFYQMKHLKQFFLNTRQIDYDYTQISTIDQYWNWLENSFVSNIRAQQWYNNDSPRNLNGFINDKSNRLIGWAIMRQIRLQTSLCSHQKMIINCRDDVEEKRSFDPGWMNVTTATLNSSIDQAFQYRLGKDGGYVYEFRGRLSDLRTNLSKLHQLEWIDNLTQLVIIQLSLYNPNSQLFTSITLLSEFLSTGGVIPQARFDPFNYHLALTSTFQLICAIFYIAFLFYLMFIQIKALFHFKSNYFRQFWSYIDLGIISCSWASIGVYLWRYKEAKRIGDLFKETNGYIYINFQLAVYVNDMLTCFLGLCCFFGTIKFIRLCRFNPRLLFFIKTVQYAGKDLLSFSLMFSIVFLAFVALFYLLFLSTISHCSSLLKTAETLFEMTLMKFDASELIQAAPFLGPFCFSVFIFLVVFVCMSMFLTIINDSFRQVRKNVNDDQEIFSFMWNKFQHWIGLKKASEEEIHEEQDARMRTQYIDTIEDFPNKIDQLLDGLNRIYISQRTNRI